MASDLSMPEADNAVDLAKRSASACLGLPRGERPTRRPIPLLPGGKNDGLERRSALRVRQDDARLGRAGAGAAAIADKECPNRSASPGIAAKVFLLAMENWRCYYA